MTMETPQKEHACGMPEATVNHLWLKKLAGEWLGNVQFMADANNPMETTSTEIAYRVGDFWLKSEITNPDMHYHGLLTLGYDREKDHFVGTWMDSFSDHLWKYEGNLDEAGKTLTLHTEGPFMGQPGKLFQYKEVIELIDDNNKVFKSQMQQENGEWATMLTVRSTRKK